MSVIRPFHLAVSVHDIAQAKAFYGGLMGCSEGRSSSRWVDFDFFGHQFVCHLDENHNLAGQLENTVDGDAVPVPHFGVVLTMADWEALRVRLTSAGVRFVIEPRIRFRGKAGEQATMFFTDPSGNALEFKAFNDDSRIFSSQVLAS